MAPSIFIYLHRPASGSSGNVLPWQDLNSLDLNACQYEVEAGIDQLEAPEGSLNWMFLKWGVPARHGGSWIVFVKKIQL